MRRSIYGFIIVDKNGVPQGLDNPSGGYPYPTEDIKSVNIWTSLEEVQHYHKVINYNDKGYIIRRAKLSLTDVSFMEGI